MGCSTRSYDAARQRITKPVGSGNTEVYILDGATTLAVFTVNSGGTATSWYFNLHADDRVVGRHPNTGTRSYYYTDMLGSTRSVVQSTTVVESYDFDPWGLLMPGRTFGSGTKEAFSGKEQDVETGLDYFGARFYMPALGRWGAVDPMSQDALEWSPYGYVYNNPMLRTDPDGREVTEIAGGRRLTGQAAQVWWKRYIDSHGDESDQGTGQAPQGAAQTPEARREAYQKEWSELGGPSGWTPPFPVCRGTARCTHWRVQNQWAGAAETENENDRYTNLAIGFVGSMEEIGVRLKPINLPAWRKVAVDMEHILSGHVEGGPRVSVRKALFFSTMSPKGIEQALRMAYTYGRKVAVYGDLVIIRGEARGSTIEMWFNRKTMTIETAYPVSSP